MEEYEVDLRDYIRIIWAKKWIILAVFVLSVITAVLVSFKLPNEYETKAVYQLKSVSTVEGIKINIPSLQQTIALLKSRDLLTKTVEELKLTNESDFVGSSPATITSWLEENLKASNLTGTDLLELKLKGALKPELLKNILAKHLTLFKKEIEKTVNEEIKSEIGRIEDKERLLKAQKEELLKQFEEVNRSETQEATLKIILLLDLNSRLQYANQQLMNLNLAKEGVQKLINSWSPLEIISSPFTPEASVGPNRKMNIIIAGVLGLFLGVLLAFFVHYMEGGSKSLPIEKSQVNIKRGGEER